MGLHLISQYITYWPMAVLNRQFKQSKNSVQKLLNFIILRAKDKISWNIPSVSYSTTDSYKRSKQSHDHYYDDYWISTNLGASQKAVDS